MLRMFRWILIVVVLTIFAGAWLLSVSMSWSMLTWNDSSSLHNANSGDPVLHQHQHLYVEMIGKRIEIYPIWLPHIGTVAGAVVIVTGLMFLLRFRSRSSIVDIGTAAEDEKVH